MMTMRPHLLALALVPLALTGCPPKDDGDTGGTSDIGCTAEARASVQVEVLDESGAVVPEASLTYDAGDGPVACEEMPDGVHVCGWEVAGTLHIVAEAEGFVAAETDVEVTSDVCHVTTEQIQMVLVAE